MLRVIIGLLVLSSCSMGALKHGGEESYVYDQQKEYSREELKALAPKVITTSQRDPHVGKLKDLFGPGQRPLKRIGIIIFESQLQPTRSGLAGEDLVYLSESGKQLMTEKLLKIWEQILPTVAPELDYVPTSRIKRSKNIHQFGLEVNDSVKARRETLEPDDIFYLEKGKHTTTATVFNPRGMQDLSIALVPATDLMGGPKWSEQNKQFVNEMAKELNLDAVLIVMSEISWTTARIDKNSGEAVAEGINIKLSSSTLVSLSDYRTRAEKLKLEEAPSVSLCHRTYEVKLHLPSTIAVPTEEQSFSTIQDGLLRPVFKSYTDLAIMMAHEISHDLKQTF